MKVGEEVEVKEYRGSRWLFDGRRGHITEVDDWCYSVRTDDGENIRDLKEHFRTVP